MAVQKITSVSSGKSDASAVIELTGVATSDWYRIPQGCLQAAIEAIPAVGASVSVQGTLDAANIDENDGVGAVGVAWPQGDVTVNTQTLLRGAVAVRFVCSAGAGGRLLINTVFA